jgi:hypothetical protein
MGESHRQRRMDCRNTAAACLPGESWASTSKQLRRSVEELQEDTRTRRGDTRKGARQWQRWRDQRRTEEKRRRVAVRSFYGRSQTTWHGECRAPRGLGHSQVAIRMRGARRGALACGVWPRPARPIVWVRHTGDRCGGGPTTGPWSTTEPPRPSVHRSKRAATRSAAGCVCAQHWARRRLCSAPVFV